MADAVPSKVTLNILDELLTLFQLLLQGGQGSDITKSGLLYAGLDLLDSLLGGLGLGVLLGDLGFLIGADVGHPETDQNTGKQKAKTIGRMLDEKLTIEGCFDIVMHARVDGTGHYFTTQSDGTDTAKSPEDMFEMRIPNDLALVDRTIREYYGIAE